MTAQPNHMQSIVNRELVDMFANVISTATLQNLFPPAMQAKSLRSLHNNDANKHQLHTRHTGI